MQKHLLFFGQSRMCVSILQLISKCDIEKLKNQVGRLEMLPNPSFEGIKNVKPLCVFEIKSSFFVHGGFKIIFIGSQSEIDIFFFQESLSFAGFAASFLGN